jgi:hypothetical protein
MFPELRQQQRTIGYNHLFLFQKRLITTATATRQRPGHQRMFVCTARLKTQAVLLHDLIPS